MLLILTPSGAHLPAFKENQYILIYSFFFFRKETKIVFCLGSQDVDLLRLETLVFGAELYNLSHTFYQNTMPPKNKNIIISFQSKMSY